MHCRGFFGDDNAGVDFFPKSGTCIDRISVRGSPILHPFSVAGCLYILNHPPGYSARFMQSDGRIERSQGIIPESKSRDRKAYQKYCCFEIHRNLKYERSWWNRTRPLTPHRKTGQFSSLWLKKTVFKIVRADHDNFCHLSNILCDVTLSIPTPQAKKQIRSLNVLTPFRGGHTGWHTARAGTLNNRAD